MTLPQKIHQLNTDKDVFIACKDNLSFVKSLQDESMKLIVTSPPYNIGKEYEVKTPLENYISSQAGIISECVRLLHPNGSLCWQVGNHVQNGEVFPLDLILYHIFKDHGLKLRNRIIWHFGHGLHCTKRFSGRHETILWFTKTNEYTFNLDPVRVPSKYPGKKHFKGPNKGKLSCNPLGKNPSDVWEIPNVKSNHCEKTIHPCQFPIELVERLVLSMTDEGENVFDPYMGGRLHNYRGDQKQKGWLWLRYRKKYVDTAWDRIKQLRKGTLKIRPMDKPVYDPSLPNGGHK